MKSNPGKIAADAIEGAPEVRRLVMRIVYAKIAEPRHVRYLTRDALSCSLEKHA